MTDPLTRDQIRGRRRREIRSKTINTNRISQAQLAQIRRATDYPEGVERPKTRGECQHGARPCPFVSCKYHLYLDVSPRSGSIKLNFPDLEVWEMGESCALDVAEREGITLEEVGEKMNLTRERSRQLQSAALAKLKDRDMDDWKCE